MPRYAVELKVNLKISSGEVLTRGHLFSGPLNELPDYIQDMVKEKSRHLEVRKLPEPVEVQQEDTIPEVVEEEVVEIEKPPKQSVKKESKAKKADSEGKSTVKRRTRKE